MPHTPDLSRCREEALVLPRCRASSVTMVLVSMLTVACSSSATRSIQRNHGTAGIATVSGLQFVPSPSSLIRECVSTARAVGYPVPCPSRVPPSLRAFPSRPVDGCGIEMIGPGGQGGCAHAWRGWVVGSSASPHLVLEASPTPVTNLARMINGPAWRPGMAERRIGTLRMGGSLVQLAVVPPDTNPGSAFAGHVAMIWTVGGHTYAVGFHDVTSVRATIAWDRALRVRLVPP